MVVLVLAFALPGPMLGQDIFEVKTGVVHFHSEAPTELISASSPKLTGTINVKNRTFSFSISIASFAGFKCHLMANRFNKDFMESDLFPSAFFTGKIIEDIDLSKNGVYNIRAKGKLKVHGVEQDRLIKAVVTSKNGTLTIESEMHIELADYNIQVPRAFFQTIASDIDVSVRASLAPKET